MRMLSSGLIGTPRPTRTSAGPPRGRGPAWERPGARPAIYRLTQDVSLILPYELEQLAECPPAALLGHGCRILAGSADEAAQLLHVAVGVLCRPAGQRVVARDEFDTPALG